MSHGVHVVGHSGLRIVQIVHEVVHNVPYSRLPSAVTDIFTIKFLNSILAETHSANE